jgi:hypothetical protein
MRHRATVERVQRCVAQGKPVPYQVVLAVNLDYVSLVIIRNMLGIFWNFSYIRNEYSDFFYITVRKTKDMPWPEKFRAAIEKGVRDIAGELRKLNAGEKRLLLAILRKLDDCPDGWKNRKNMAPKKQQSILKSLHDAIDRLLNPEKARAINAKCRKKRRENGKEKAYTVVNKEKKAKYNHKYNADPMNKDKANARLRERYATDLKYRTMVLLRSRLRRALGNNKKDHAIDLLGCTVEQMVQHIEKQFTPGMTWNNRGKADDEWEIDHIVPFAAFDLSIAENQFIVSWYQNLQPLWRLDNRSKGGKSRG